MQPNLSEKMASAGYKSHYIRFVGELLTELDQNNVDGTDRLRQLLAERAGDKEGFEDVLTEGRFALVLVKNGFEVHLEPARSGPDLRATWNSYTLYFEVTTRRPSWDDAAVVAASGQGRAVWVGLDRPENAVSKVSDKLAQLREGEINMVALLSRSVTLDDYVAAEAFECLERAIEGEPDAYRKLSGVLFTSGMDMSTGIQFHVYKNAGAICPIDAKLEHKLRGLQDQELATWAKELARALEVRLQAGGLRGPEAKA